MLGVPGLAELLGGAWPTAYGWALAALAIPILLTADTLHKAHRRPSARCWRRVLSRRG
ncbi:hypothetical protein [Micromonospora globispora]|uniref:hypothetical protein n=1 Tax=Micromonospora globispora TaxID=1450148 RepID=UPI001403DB90|nr:hypothetical protein [Micromonospora globispora]